MKESKEKLKEYIKTDIDEFINNRKLRKKINELCASKNLSMARLSAVYNNGYDLNYLNEIEIMLLADALHSVIKKEVFDLRGYFTDSEILEYQKYILEEKELLYRANTIVVDNCRKINDTLYQAYFTLKEIYTYMNSGLLRYNKKTQRKSKVKVIGTNDFIVREIFVNKQAVEQIKQRFLNNNYIPDTVALNITVIEGKNSQYSFENDLRNKEIGTLTIEPNDDTSSESTTEVAIIDGYHRILGATEAFKEYYSKTGLELQGGLFVTITALTVREARDYIARIFERTDTNKDWMKSIVNDDYNKFVENMIKKFRKFSETDFAEDWEDLTVYKKMTTIPILYDAIKKSNIDLSSSSNRIMKPSKFAEIIELQIDLLCERLDLTLEQAKGSFILKPNMFVVYVGTANKLSDIKEMDDIAMRLLDINEEIIELYNNKKLEGLSSQKSDSINSAFNSLNM